MRLAIIPARGGSKRIVGKNARLFCGRPILAYTIEAALGANSIDRVWVSTDDPAIATLAREQGAECPFVRPAALADDHAVLADVMRHAVTEARAHGLQVESACLLFATAPLMSSRDIDRGFDVLRDDSPDLVLSVARFNAAPQRAQRVDETGALTYVYPEHRLTRSQDLEPLYHDAAQFVWGTDAAWTEPLPNPRIAPLTVAADRVVDIDEPDDWERAERLFRSLRDEPPRLAPASSEAA